MTFHDWLFGGIENPAIKGQWGPLHIATLLICIALIVAFPLVTKRLKSVEKSRKIVIFTLAALILFFEIVRRIVQFILLSQSGASVNLAHQILEIIIPRPWCAVSCWLLIASVIVRRPFFYNFASVSALLCSVIYFAYPGVGFNNQYILFDNLYSIATHALLLTMSITLMTLGFATFRFRDLWKTVLAFALTIVYGLIEIFVLKVYSDPMYFMPNGDIQADILGIGYGLYLFLYTLLISLFILVPHLISERGAVRAFIARLKK